VGDSERLMVCILELGNIEHSIKEMRGNLKMKDNDFSTCIDYLTKQFSKYNAQGKIKPVVYFMFEKGDSKN
jgi:hypothetical protein